MKSSNNASYQQTLQTAWNTFGINFNINLQQRVADGIEAFGFGSQFNDPCADDRLLNELPFLSHFTKLFRKKHQKLFDLLDDNMVDIGSHFGTLFYEKPAATTLPSDRKKLLCKMGLDWIFELTAREKDVLGFLSSGQSASYIARELHLSKRTVENYIATVKSKLCITSKADLIDKAKELEFLSP
jgi:DNA-binding CsgD family transcriptional regulator